MFIQLTKKQKNSKTVVWRKQFSDVANVLQSLRSHSRGHGVCATYCEDLSSSLRKPSTGPPQSQFRCLRYRNEPSRRLHPRRRQRLPKIYAAGHRHIATTSRSVSARTTRARVSDGQGQGQGVDTQQRAKPGIETGRLPTVGSGGTYGSLSASDCASRSGKFSRPDSSFAAQQARILWAPPRQCLLRLVPDRVVAEVRP